MKRFFIDGLQKFIFFYLTSAGAEIDLVLEWDLKEIWAMEIKSSHTSHLKKGFHTACEDLKVKRQFLMDPGEDTFSLGHDVIALILQEVKKYR